MSNDDKHPPAYLFPYANEGLRNFNVKVTDFDYIIDEVRPPLRSMLEYILLSLIKGHPGDGSTSDQGRLHAAMEALVNVKSPSNRPMLLDEAVLIETARNELKDLKANNKPTFSKDKFITDALYAVSQKEVRNNLTRENSRRKTVRTHYRLNRETLLDVNGSGIEHIKIQQDWAVAAEILSLFEILGLTVDKSVIARKSPTDV